MLLGTSRLNNALLNEVWEYNTVTDSWKRLSDFPGMSREMAVGFAVGGKGYLGLGVGNGAYLKDVWEYNASSDTWSQIGDFTGVERSNAYSFVIGNTAYVGGGLSSNAYLKDFWSFDASSKVWSRKSDAPVTNANHTALSDGSNGYFLDVSNANFYKYNPLIDSWSQQANFPEVSAFNFAISASIGHNGYIFDLNNDFFFQYDPIGDRWNQFVARPQLFSRIGFTANNKFYLTLGYKLLSFTSWVNYYETWELDMSHYPQ